MSIGALLEIPLGPLLLTTVGPDAEEDILLGDEAAAAYRPARQRRRTSKKISAWVAIPDDAGLAHFWTEHSLSVERPFVSKGSEARGSGWKVSPAGLEDVSCLLPLRFLGRSP